MTRWLALPLLLLATTLAHAQQTTPPPTTTDETQPLPPVPNLILAVEKHEDRDDALLQQYTYHLHVIDEEFDGSDAVRKTTTEDYESIPINGVRVRKLVARNGKPLTADEAKKEDADFDKEIEKAKKNKAKYEEKRAQATREGKSNDGFLPASRILALGTFSNERRVMLDGRPTIVLDYAGNRNVKTENSLEKIVEDLVGTVWIDEQDKVLARVEGHFLADFKLGFGLIADIHKGLAFTMQQKKVNGEVWLPQEIDGHGKASILVVVARVHGHTHATMSDFRKYHASATIVGVSGVVDDQGNPIDQPTPPKP